MELLYDQLLALAAVNPALSGLSADIEAIGDAAAAGDSAAVLAQSTQLFSANPPPAGALVAPKLSLAPAGLELENNDAGAFSVRLENPGTQPVTIELGITSPLPAGVTADLNRTSITLAPGEILDAGAMSPVLVNVTTGNSPQALFPIALAATLAAVPGFSLQASSQVAVRSALADVLDVTPTPAALDSGQRNFELAVRVLNSANSRRDVLAAPQVVDLSGNVVASLPPVQLTLQPATDPLVFDLGSQSLIGVADGIYRVRVSLQDVAGQPLPGRSSATPLFVGALVSASASADRSVLPPGTSSVTTLIDVTNRGALSGGDGSLAQLVEFHVPNAIVDAQSSLADAVGDPLTVLGPPEVGDSLSLNGGTLTLDLGEGGNHAIDGPGDDILILEGARTTSATTSS